MIDSDDIPSNPSTAASFKEVLRRRTSTRRSFVKTALATGVAAASGISGCAIDLPNQSEPLGFAELNHGLDGDLNVSPGYRAQTLLRWGDPIFASAPEFDPENQTEKAQLQQFGYNNDYIAFLPLPLGSNNSDAGLMVVNHEYCRSRLMYPGAPGTAAMDEEQVRVNKACVGLSVVEVKQSEGSWQVDLDSPYNRRITPDTKMQLTGAAAGNHRLFTNYSDNGIDTWGTYGNCAGGLTPWGTVLTAEENIQDFFSGEHANADIQQRENYQRFGIRENNRGAAWRRFFDRWDVAKNPNEPLHMGWIVEIDPFDPESVPKKRTGIGRYKHEGCNVTINADGYVVAYSGDDQVHEYLYRFISKNKYQEDNRQANMDLLEEGILYVAEFDETGVNWNPLVYGEGPLTEANGFANQADVCLDTRKAADLVGATPMDRPEDVEVNPVTGSVFAMLTKSPDRQSDDLNPVNPRPENRGGHILELIPPNGDHRADRFDWEMFLLGGSPDAEGSSYHSDTTENGWLACPDNCAFDNFGNIWIATDGAYEYGIADGVWAAPVSGPNRGKPKHFLRTPIGAELCGPCFTPDNRSFFCAVQHPSEGDNYETPRTRWPDFDEKMPPRPSMVVVTHPDGKVVGS